MRVKEDLKVKARDLREAAKESSKETAPIVAIGATLSGTAGRRNEISRDLAGPPIKSRLRNRNTRRKMMPLTSNSKRRSRAT